MEPVYCYFGHPKSGSTWLGGIMGRVAIEMGQPFLYRQLALGNTVYDLNKGNFRFLISQNTSYAHVQKIKRPFRGFHVIRDPRDISVSAYFSYKKTHAIRDWGQLQQLRDKLNAIAFQEGLLETIKFNASFFKYMSNWDFRNPNIYEIKFENLIAEPSEKLKEIFNHLEIVREGTNNLNLTGKYNRVVNKLGASGLAVRRDQLTSVALNDIVKTLSFQNLTKGRKQGTENTDSHYRKGESGDWKEHFTNQHKDYFKEHFGTLLIELGYEKDLNW
jgi:Sulfotransferase domain